MKVTLNWLKEYVDFSLSPADIAKILTMAGLEVEEYHTETRDFSNLVVAKVESVAKHPNADKLSVCTVNTGVKQLQIVCGAPNVAAGMLAPLALAGATVAGGLKIEARAVRGVPSDGMLCSEVELGLSERADGLMVLPENTPLGMKMEDFIGEADTVFDIFITPNRPDCMSVIGIARVLAAFTGAKFIKPVVKFSAPLMEPVEKSMSVEIMNSDKCARYSGRLIRDVQIKQSPFWLANRLHTVGIRSINNVVDITNYVMMETGQPLHAFDYDRLAGKKIIVREAVEGEKFVTLDNQEHTLNKEALLICDAEKPVALAGVMGGINSEVEDSTRTVFLESAYFDPANIRFTAKNLEMMTEASRRMEKGIDPDGTVYAMDRAVQLMEELAVGRIVQSCIDNYPRKIDPVKIDLSVGRINTLLGTSLSAQEIIAFFPALEITLLRQDGDLLHIIVPTFRPDLTREVDIIEEIAMLYGYDNIRFELAPKINQTQEQNPNTHFRDQIRYSLAGFGFRETISYSLISEKLAEPFLADKCEFIKLLNPLSLDMAGFRPSLILSLLTNVAYNRNRQMPDMRFFEIGNVAWKEPQQQGFTEITQIGAILAGKKQQQAWNAQAAGYDFYDIKGAVTAFLRKCGIHNFEQGTVREKIWDKESSSILINGKYCGAFGKINAALCSLFKIKVPDVYAFFINYQDVYENRATGLKYTAISKFPSIPFDLALLVDAGIALHDIEKEIWQSAGPHLVNLKLFDYYQGEQIQQGKKSIAFSLTFSSKECTLSVEEVDRAVKNVLSHLNKLFGAILRPG
ncbi:MAG TPA: phenylalanine--tRNA ligase subunit beta [bacterium]|nr:phenylalanine--tRNA ligase subunit beta [bacterium]HPN42312.1 phenylalanine--tRNA ligase subunit beta [bacterium]